MYIQMPKNAIEVNYNSGNNERAQDLLLATGLNTHFYRKTTIEKQR